MADSVESGPGAAERVPPCSIEAEVCVLGAMMLDPAAVDLAVQLLRADSFYRPAHTIVFQAIADLRDARKPVDLVLLKDELIRRGQLDAPPAAATSPDVPDGQEA